MDLSTVLTKIDQQKYTTVKEYLHDVDLIWRNALEYNPDNDPYGTLTRAYYSFTFIAANIHT